MPPWLHVMFHARLKTWSGLSACARIYNCMIQALDGLLYFLYPQTGLLFRA